ncbi:MAG: Inosine-uridine preferring nucleoside hydrolase [uncultured Truepera sp.]|uniref:Inosine-uridine preferring nucleoside hydrolase n=1 Tax=uncultured Truepera sp. TaxID=543023 RepID=A0A6J4V0F6_9DEIN|nr:MAG: Inosine-uridine preferring nucleoside hydrolase [uncultured Truepera sp.]
MSRTTYRTALLTLILLAACSQTATVPEATPKPVPETAPDAAPEPAPRRTGVPIIFDTDLGYDCDDAGALAVLHALADRGEANILATMTVVGDPHSAGALDVINTYYGRPDIPVGAYQGERWADARPYWYGSATDFLTPLVEGYPSSIKHKDSAPDAVQLYRKLLAAQPDNSVTVVAVGFSLNLANLLASAPDALSPLDGRALVGRKVKRLVYMGGMVQGTRPDFNLGDGPYRNGSTARRVLAGWPTEIVFAGAEIGRSIMTGSSLQAHLPDNPVARAYDLYPGTNRGGERPSWDLTAVLYAVRGGGDFWRVVRDEHLTISADGTTRWQAGAVSPARHRLEQTSRSRDVEGALEGLLN